MTQSYPLKWPEGWPRTKNYSRQAYARFKTTFPTARQQLYDELERLKARSVVVSSWLPLRLDGQPRADAARMRIEDPGVAVYFELRGRPMVMARDVYQTVHDNLRSIGLAIEHLRGLERHGGAQMMERAFDGFAAIAAPDKIDCFVTLGVQPSASEDEIKTAFNRLAMTVHPDRGGSAEALHKLVQARDLAVQTRRAA